MTTDLDPRQQMKRAIATQEARDAACRQLAATANELDYAMLTTDYARRVDANMAHAAALARYRQVMASPT